VAAIAMIGIPEPNADTVTTGSLMRDAWLGLLYVWRNPTLRGLGFAISTLNLMGGITTIAVPLIVLDRLRLGETAVGLAFSVSGVTGMLSALWFGRHDTRGREWPMLVWPMLAMAPVYALLLPVAGVGPDDISPLLGFALVCLVLGVSGVLNGPLDIALFTVRQRRTDPAVMGRAFAVSMAFNFTGFPIGAAIAGAVASGSLAAAIVIGVAACALAAVFAGTQVPRVEQDILSAEQLTTGGPARDAEPEAGAPG
jgi:hypothetical protein